MAAQPVWLTSLSTAPSRCSIKDKWMGGPRDSSGSRHQAERGGPSTGPGAGQLCSPTRPPPRGSGEQQGPSAESHPCRHMTLIQSQPSHPFHPGRPSPLTYPDHTSLRSRTAWGLPPDWSGLGPPLLTPGLRAKCPGKGVTLTLHPLGILYKSQWEKRRLIPVRSPELRDTHCWTLTISVARGQSINSSHEAT